VISCSRGQPAHARTCRSPLAVHTVKIVGVINVRKNVKKTFVSVEWKTWPSFTRRGLLSKFTASGATVFFS